MANKTLFSTRGVAATNHEGAPAYAYAPNHALAQYAVTGCLSNTFYAAGEAQLETVLELASRVEPQFVAQCAVYAREKGAMKDMPALLLAALSTKSIAHLKQVFPRVVDNGRMLRNFVQIMRSGAVGRKSLGSAPKALVRGWLDRASERALLDASVGNDPSLSDVVRMVHPKPADATREAFYAWLLGKPYASERLPQTLQRFERFKTDRSAELPDVPFQMLTALNLQREEWARVATRGRWHMVRMNLNTFARHGVFDVPGVAEAVAEKLRDRDAIKRARVFPHQLMAAFYTARAGIPAAVKAALQDAMEIAVENVPPFGAGSCANVVVCPDVSGSMSSSVTGSRRGATSVMRCIDVAALVAAAVLRANPAARVLPFEQRVVHVELNPRDTVMTNAARLSAVGGGGTSCSAPLRLLADWAEKVDLVIFVSDNQSWVDARADGTTETMRQWARVKAENPNAKLVCIDLQPYGTTQAAERADVLNVGGFSDEVFNLVARFARGELEAGHWVREIESVTI
jgi:60 kDa SS-A/Ro ribonucleoprotein